jgi:dsDNA-binding SOS-regulon protein
MKSSGDKTTKEIINPYITGTAIASGILLISAFFIFAISEEASHVSFSENLKIFLRQPLAWIAVVSAIAMTFVARHISSKMAADITRLKNITEKCDEKMESVYKFSRSLLNDDFNVTFALKEETDRLSETLVMLRDKLTLNRQQEQKRREEESIRNWLAESESHFSEILRNNLNNPEELSFQVLKDLTRNINAVQGGFYILDDGDENNKFFNLLSFFAFDRKKFADRRIKWGDGLIGTCALEKKTILLNNIPETYIKVTSGLGEAKPGFLLLEPMIYENKVYGVLEFASLSAFQHSISTL